MTTSKVNESDASYGCHFLLIPDCHQHDPTHSVCLSHFDDDFHSHYWFACEILDCYVHCDYGYGCGFFVVTKI